MGLVVYECQRADHAHEIREFEGVARALRAYYDGRKELALLIGNVNVGNVELDGIIVKEDAIVILELKDHAGTIVARMNGHWTCDGEIIRGGSNKTVFEQIQVNKRNLRTAIEKNGYFTSAQANDVQGIVVFSAMKKWSMSWIATRNNGCTSRMSRIAEVRCMASRPVAGAIRVRGSRLRR